MLYLPKLTCAPGVPGARWAKSFLEREMRKTVVPLLLTLLLLFSLVACGDDEAQLKKLAGVWFVDVEASLALDESMKEMSAEEREFALSMAQVLLSAMTMEFDVVNKKLIPSIGGMRDPKDFTVEPPQGKNLVLKSDDDTLIVEFRDDDTIIFGENEGNRLVFVRKK